MPSFENGHPRANLRLIFLLPVRTSMEDWQKDTLYPVLSGTIQSQSRYVEGQGSSLEVCWIEYGGASESVEDMHQVIPEAAFAAEPDLEEALKKARELILEAVGRHNPNPILILVTDGETWRQDILGDASSGTIQAVIYLKTVVPEDMKNHKLVYSAATAGELNTSLSSAIPECVVTSLEQYKVQREVYRNETREESKGVEDQPAEGSQTRDLLMTEQQTDETAVNASGDTTEVQKDMGNAKAEGPAEETEILEKNEAEAGATVPENDEQVRHLEKTDGEANALLTGPKPDPEVQTPTGLKLGTEVQTPTEPGKHDMPRVISMKERDDHFVERAAHKEEYCTYEHYSFAAEDGIRYGIYNARRIGFGHLVKKMPCQDYCLYSEHAHGFVLIAADGVSACPRSDLGSKIACESAAFLVAEFSRKKTDEEDFVREVCSDAFFQSIRTEWVRRITEDWNQNKTEKSVSIPRLYGTTLLFAVATKHWWILRNIGDGQIILFNAKEFQRIRLSEKDSPAPRGLMYDTYLEHVQTGVFPREQFTGVLLTTDGMADQMAKIGPDSWHIWALQLQKRFAEAHEPYLPFVYEGMIANESRRPDLSRQRNASDDCTVALAFTEDVCPPAWMGEVHEAIALHFEERVDIELHRTLGDRASYMVYTKTEKIFVCALPGNVPCAVRSPRFGFEDLLLFPQTKEDIWTAAGYCFYAYHLENILAPCSLEEKMQSFGYCSHTQTSRGVSLNTGEKILKVNTDANRDVSTLYTQLRELRLRLEEEKLYLDWTAPYWIFTDLHGKLLIPQAVICEAEQKATLPWMLTTAALSPALLGFVSGRHQPWAFPVFSPGDAAETSYYYLTGESQADQPEEKRRFFSVVRHPQSGRLGLRNVSHYPWKVKDKDGTEVDCATGGVAMLKDGRQITVVFSSSEQQTYTITFAERQ